jgi:hypothetical protein
MCGPQSKEHIRLWLFFYVYRQARCRRSGLERMLEPVQRRIGARIATDGDDIEPAGGIGPPRFLLEEQLGGEYELFLLAVINAFQCSAPSGVATIANFDEYYCIAVEHDQIKLAAPARPVLRNQRQTLLLEVPQGEGFRLAPCVLPRTALHQGAVSGRRWILPSTN